MNVPFERSYWVEPGLVLAGCYPGDKAPAEAERKLRGLLECGVKRTISLMEPDEKSHGGVPFVAYEPELRKLAGARGQSVDCRRYAILDRNVPSMALLGEILACLQESRARGEAVYMHCWGGRGRTGTVVACHLRQTLGLSGPAALARLQELIADKAAHFNPTPENDRQEQIVRDWQP